MSLLLTEGFQNEGTLTSDIPIFSTIAAQPQVLGMSVSVVRTARGLCTIVDESRLTTLCLLKIHIAAVR